MKLPRYPIARSVPSEIQSAKASLISPAEAANVQLAKAGAISSVAESIGGAIMKVDDVRQKARDAEDNVKAQTNENFLKAAYDSLLNDPNLDKDVQDDGTPTTEYLQRETDALLKTYKEGAESIKNPVTRKRLQQFMVGKEAEYRADLRGRMGNVESRIATNSLNKALLATLALGDQEGGEALISQGVADGLLDVLGAEKWREEFKGAAIKVQAADHVMYVDQGFAVSEEEGQERLSELIKDTSIDSDVRNLAIAGAEKRASSWSKARAKEREQQEVDAIISYGDDATRAKSGDLSPEEVDASYAAGKYGEGKGAATRRNQLNSLIEAGIKRKEDQLNVGEQIRNGQFITNDTKSRNALSDYESSVIEGMGAEEGFRAIADISRIAGTVSTQTERALDLAGVSEAAAAQVLPLYRELTSEPGLHPDMHLDPTAAAFLEDASTLMDSGVGMAEAVTIAWGNKNITETEKIERGIRWNESGIESAQGGYKELIDSDWYEEPGFGDIEDPPAMMNIEYGQIYKSVFNQTGNEVAAKNLADQTIKKTWVMTNFNSANPKEYTVQKYGIPGDSRYVRSSVIKELEQETFKRKIDPEKITFETFDERSEAFDPDGNQRFKVKQDGEPLYRVSDDGVEVATVVIEKSKIQEHTKISTEREQLESRIKDIESEEARLTNLTEKNIYSTTTPQLTTPRKKRLTGLGKENKKLQESLKTTGVHF